MLNTDKSRDSGFLSLSPVPSMITPIKWFVSLIGSVIAINAISLNKYICLSIILWGMWGDSVLSLMPCGFEAPRMGFFVGEIPHKKWGGVKASNQANKTVPHKKCGELPTRLNAASLVSRGFAAYLPNSPRFTDIGTYMFLMLTHNQRSMMMFCSLEWVSKADQQGSRYFQQLCPLRVIRAALFLSFCVSIGLNYSSLVLI
jgi:hypothetical protein